MVGMYNLIPSSTSSNRTFKSGHMKQSILTQASVHLLNKHFLCLNDRIYKSYSHTQSQSLKPIQSKHMHARHLTFLSFTSISTSCIKLVPTANFQDKHNHIVLQVLLMFIYVMEPDLGNSSSSAGEIILALCFAPAACATFSQILLGQKHISKISCENNNRANISFEPLDMWQI